MRRARSALASPKDSAPHENHPRWKRGIYPTKANAEEGFEKGLDMKIAKKENATETNESLKEDYISLKVVIYKQKVQSL